MHSLLQRPFEGANDLGLDRGSLHNEYGKKDTKMVDKELQITQEFFDRLYGSIDGMPYGARWIFKQLGCLIQVSLSAIFDLQKC